jgi:hypothetical protein
MSIRFDKDTEEVHIRPSIAVDGLVVIDTKPASYRQWFVNEPPPFGSGQAGPFDTLADAFAYMRSRGYVLNENVCAEMIAKEDAE